MSCHLQHNHNALATTTKQKQLNTTTQQHNRLYSNNITVTEQYQNNRINSNTITTATTAITTATTYFEKVQGKKQDLFNLVATNSV